MKNVHVQMFLVLGGFLAGSFWLLGGIFANYRSSGWIINIFGMGAVLALNVVTMVPIVRPFSKYQMFVNTFVRSYLTLTNSTRCTFLKLTCKGFPDETVHFHTACMCVMNTFDAAFFVAYGAILGSLGTFLSVSSLFWASNSKFGTHECDL